MNEEVVKKPTLFGSLYKSSPYVYNEKLTKPTSILFGKFLRTHTHTHTPTTRLLRVFSFGEERSGFLIRNMSVRS